MENTREKNQLIEELKRDVENHHVLTHPWLDSKSVRLTLSDLHLWLSQEYFVSVDFVNWFLLAAAQTDNLKAKIIIVHNIWEELGEGIEKDSHVKILEKFIIDTGSDPSNLKALPGTKKYLEDMKEIILSDFYMALGALGPANEYLLNLEYGKMYNAYQKLKQERKLPEAHFFQVNLDADESHSKVMFELIASLADTEEKKQRVKTGNRNALDSRNSFYDGLLELEKSL